MPSKNLPKISIITPSYNQGEFLEETIQSVLSQKYPNLEYIIIDGGSSDRSAEIISKYEQYLAYWVSEKDRGQAHAINKGFIRATGDILAWLNSDDFHYPDTLKYIAQAYQKYPEAGLYIGNGYIVDKNRTIIRPFSLNIGFDAETLINGQNYINQPSAFINRKAVDKVGLLDESLNNEFDVEYWIRIGRQFEAVVMDEFLSAFRWYEEIKTASSGFNRWVEMYKVRQKYTSMGLTPGLLVEFFHIAKNQPLLNEMGKDIKSLIEKAYELTFSRNQKSLNLTNNVPAGRGIYFVPDKKASLPAAEQKISAPPVIRHTGSRLRVDIVLQATGTHSWSVYGGWANAAHKLGVLNKVFAPKAQWGDPDVTDDDGLLSYLLNPQADIMLLPGFDWHSQMLHTSKKWKDRWMNADILKILFSHEAIEKSCIMFENNLVKDAALSASQCIDGIVHIDLNDTAFWKQTNKPLLWQILGVDDRIFFVRKAFRERIARPFFRGQFTPHFTSKTYDQRRAFMQFLIDKNAVEVLEYIRGQKPDKVVDDFNNYQIAVNLPTLSAYHPSRVTEAMACGCALVTNRTGISQIDDLFTHGEHLLYYSTKEELLKAVQMLSADRAFSERLAQKGHDYALGHFTLDKLMLEIIGWTNSSKILKGEKKEHFENFIHLTDKKQDIEIFPSAEQEKKTSIIIDGAIFYLQQGRPLGISRVWKSLLTKLSNTPLAGRILLLDRDSTAPHVPGIRWRTIKGYDHVHFEDDSLYLEEICREENAALFISTYYTYPENSHCALMLHDMIPELTGMDLSVPEWRAKAKAVEKALAYFSVSASTMNDFRKLYPHYSRKKIYPVHNAVSGEFRQNRSEEIMSFRKEYQIQKPYFMLVGHRSLYKNALLFFRAFSLLENKSDYEILCTGGAKELEKVFLPYVKGTRCQVRFLSDRDLSVAYSGALALIFPSQYEGFGLPVLEAMKSGCPVITCRNSSIPEVAADAAFYVDIHDVAGMKDALLKIQAPHIRESYISRGLENAKRFSWGNSCAQFVSAVKEITDTAKDVPLNLTDPLNTLDRMFRVFEKRNDCKDLLAAMTRLKEMFTGLKEIEIKALLQAENIVSDMNNDLFALIQQGVTNADESESLLYYWYGLALETRQLLQDALDAYTTAEKVPDLLKWRVKYLASDVAYRIENYELAIRLLKEILQEHPTFAEVGKRLKAVEEELKHKKALNDQKGTIQPRDKETIRQEDQKLVIRVSAIVSAYNSEKFIRGCLEDLLNQTLYAKGELEIIIIDSGSQQNEKDIVNEFQRKYTNIVYIRTENRETVYGAWNRGIRAARGMYITNANSDDRHRQDALEILKKALDEHPDIKLVYGDCYLSDTPNETFEQNPKNRLCRFPEYFPPSSILHYQFGPQPMWHKVIHDTIGYFDDSYTALGDYDFNIRFALHFRALHIAEPVGIYLKHDNAVSFRDDAADKEMYNIVHLYRFPEIIEKLYQNAGISVNSPTEKAEAILDLGIRSMAYYPPWDEGKPSSDLPFAFQCFKRAAELAPTQAGPHNNLAVTMYLREEQNEAIQYLKEISKTIHNSTIDFNLTVLSEAVSQKYMPSDLKIISSSLSLPSEQELSEGTKTVHKLMPQETPASLYSSVSGPASSERKISQANVPDKLYLLFVIHNFLTQNRGGTEIYTYHLAQKLHNAGYHIRILFSEYNPSLPYGDTSEDTHEGLPIVRMNLHPRSDLVSQFNNGQAAGAFRQFLSKNKVDLVHFHHLVGFSATCLEVCAQKGIPAVLTAYDAWLICEQMHLVRAEGNFCEKGPETVEKCLQCYAARNPLVSSAKNIPELRSSFTMRREFLKKALEWTNALLVPSTFLQDIFKEHGFLHPNTRLNPLGIYPFTPITHTPMDKKVRFTFLGNIFYTKGLDIAVRAFDLIDPQKAQLSIYGRIADKNYFNRTMAVVRPGYNVKYHDVYTSHDLPSILAHTDIAIVPSRAESYSFVVRECLHAGVPVIASEVGGIPEIIKNGENGLLFKPGDHKDLAEKLRFFIEKPQQIELLRQNIRPSRTIDEDIYQYENIYRDTVSEVTVTAKTAPSVYQEGSPELDQHASEKVVSIIIPAFNNIQLTRNCIDAIYQTAGNVPYEIIVVDNGSADGTSEYLILKSAAGRLRAIMNKENLGFSKANNQGARIAKGKYLLFLNNDTIPQPHWLEEMVKLAESDKDIAVVGSKLLYPDGTIQHAGIVFYRTKKPYHIYKGLPADTPAANKQRDYQIVTAACMLIRKDAFLAVGGFDERYRNGCEDLDFCLKIRERNKRVVYNPKSIVTHLEAQSKGRQDYMDSNRQLFEQIWKDKVMPDDTFYLQQDGMESMIDPEGVFYFVPTEKIKQSTSSIVIVTFNSSTTIRACLDSVLQHSPGAKVIVIDNASSDDTQTILREYEAGRLITAIINNENKGFSYACNQGIRASSGEYVILLNPDTVVTQEWLLRILSHFRPEVGAVGPISNYVAALQKAQLYAKEPFDVKTPINELAGKFYHWNRGQGRETKLLVGFCMAFPRKVLNDVGLLDEDLFLGNDDLEISWRLRLRGYKLIIATDTFIYHKGQVSFKSQERPPSSEESTEKLYEKLVAHYGAGNVPHPIELWGIDFFYPKGARFKSLKPTFAAVYCVYDDVSWLQDSLESVYYAVDAVFFLISDRPWHGQSTDNKTTLEFIRTFPDPHNKINIIAGVWTNETDQRNAGLDILKEKGYIYCFVIDADEIYDPADLKRMMDLVISHPEIECWHVSLDTYWKSCRYRIEPREPLRPPVFIKAGSTYFTENRIDSGTNHIVIPPETGICHHLSYAHSNDEVLKKISTFSHAHEVQPGWFETIWKRWDSDHLLTNLHPTHPQAYQRAVEQPYSALPPVLKRRFLADAKIGGDIIPGLTSIIILAHNEWDQTELCLKSISEHTPEPHEIIVVDNGSTDETRTHLRSLLKTKSNLKVVGNNANRGFAAGNNQGISIAQGEYILLLNNDTIVTEGWLHNMLDIFKRYPDTAIVGPMSNYVNGPQLVREVGYENIEEIDSFAALWRKEHEGQSYSIHRVVGFCLLTKRQVIERIGGLDEQFGSGNFEDDDFCIRASLAGYQARIAQDVFIHHTGSQTFKSAKIDFKKSLMRNWEIFKAKWRIPANVPYGIGYQLPSLLPSGESLYCPFPYLPFDHNVDIQKRWWEDMSTTKEKVEAEGKERIKGLTSIIIHISGQKEYLSKCLDSIKNHTKEPYEIILVPESTSYAPPKWLRKLIKEDSNCKLIKNSDKTGFARRCNQGINASSGEYIALVDDKVTVTEDWLSGLLDCLKIFPDTGIVGPMAINVEGPQKVPFADNNLPDNLEAYARSFRERNRYRRVRARNLDSFCMLFKHEIAENIGLFDEQFELYEYTDDDYCLRAALEGLQSIIAGDVFIHYNGHTNVMFNRQDSLAVLRDKKKFSEKWGTFDELNPESKKLFSTNTVFVADELNQKGLKEKAFVSLLEGIKVHPDDNRLHYAIAEILIEDKKFREALDILEHMPEEMKRQQGALELIGYCKEGMGLNEEAEHYADDVLLINKASARAWNLKGVVAFKKSLFADAEKCFFRALEADMGFGEASSNLGALKWIQGEKEEAFRLFEKAFILSPTLGDVVTNYYTAAVSLSKLSEAAAVFREAIALHPMNRKLQFIFIDNLLQQKKFHDAMKTMEEALATFGIDDDTLSMALNLRDRVGPMQIETTSQDSISVCMIVKNEENNIVRSLQSIKPAVNEIIVVDTGSTDRTRKIAKVYGAKVYDFPWTNNFSDARNVSLSKATCSWILVLDADEVISPSDYDALKSLVISPNPPLKKGGRKEELNLTKEDSPLYPTLVKGGQGGIIKKIAYSFVTRNYVGPVSVNWNPNDGKYSEEAGSGWFPSDKVRLFPNDKRIRFEKPVHEMVEYSLMRIGTEIRKCDIPIHHYGKLNKADIRAKGEEYYQLGKKKLSEQGKYDANALFELAVQASELEKYDEALEYWKKLALVNPDTVKAYHGIGTSCFQLGRYGEALDAFKKAIQLDPDSKDPNVMYATCELLMGNAEAAISHLEGLLRKAPMFPLALLAITAACLCSGRKKKGIEYISKVQNTQFSLAHYLKDIAKLLISLKRFDYAVSLLEAAIETNNALNETRQLLAECNQILGIEP